MFGPHLMLDCYNCGKIKLKNKNFILNFLKKLSNILGMHIICKPFIVPYEENYNTWNKGEISTVVIIVESHISIYRFPDNDGYATIDLLSCKDFDIKKEVEFAKKQLNPIKIKKNLTFRGKHFPKEKYACARVVKFQRKKINK